MSEENIKKENESNDLKFVNNSREVEVILMKKMGVPHGDTEKQLAWVKNYAKEYRDIVNDSANDKIRKLILSDEKADWDIAAAKIEELFKVHA